MSNVGGMRLGMCFDRSFPAGEVAAYARAVEGAGLDDVWLIEDCFFTAGVSLAAASLAVTERIRVGIGIMPAVARNPAITAMEIATLSGIGPGRVIAGIGHGVQEWMGQMGARPRSPLTTLEETIGAVRRLLQGERVTFDGRAVHLDDVALEQPPEPVPPVVAGVQQARSLALAGRVADGVILVEGAGPSYVRWALDHAGRSPDEFEVTTFTMLSVEDDRRDAYRNVAPFVAGLVHDRRPAFTVLPFFDELAERVQRGGAEALVEMPADHWHEIGAIGTRQDAMDHFAGLQRAGVRSANVFPGGGFELAAGQRSLLAALAHDLR